MRALLLIILLPFIIIIAIPVGGIIIGLGAGLIGVVIGIFGAIFGVITAIFATLFGGILSLGGISMLIFFKVLLVVFIVLAITSLFNRNSSSKKATKQ